MSDHDKLYVNGIDGVTGDYLVPPLELSQAAAFLKGETLEAAAEGVLPRLRNWLKSVWRALTRPHLGLPEGVDPADVRQAGWALVFHVGEDSDVKDALAPLVEHRRRLVGDDSLVKVLEVRDGESSFEWLARHGVAPGTVLPTKVPYYLLLVGSPERIPFSFGQLLDVEYAVGRLHFDTVAEYARYVASLLEYETSPAVTNAREAVFFAPRHPFDRATQLSADLLVDPLTKGIPADEAGPGEEAQPAVAQAQGFQARKLWGDAATREALASTLAPPAGARPSAFLFTASHGMGWPAGHARQRSDQGALVCQDWPGFGEIRPEHYFAAADVPAGARVHGMISFHFACYGAGTPSRDRFMHKPGQPPPVISDRPFLAALPQALLSHPQGGALACVGHVERAWGYSIVTPKAGPQLQPFQNAITRILKGHPVGYALRDFNERYAVLSTRLASMLESLDFGVPVSDKELSAAWIERNDAEGYLILGDPAAHLRAEDLS
jgi:hypothetical protein